MIDDVLFALRCPLGDAGPLTRQGSTLRCGEGHSFDVARQGYVNLLPGGAEAGTADTAAMVAARARFLATGAYDPLAAALAEEVVAGIGAAPAEPGHRDPVVDLGAGTGFYLARVLDELPGHVGLALDLSKYAARRAARAHRRIGAAVADAWRTLPVATGIADAVLSVFAPRGGDEIARILRPDGVVLVATPTAGHLAEVVEPLGLLRVEEGKQRRLVSLLSPQLVRVATRTVAQHVVLSPDGLHDLVTMGPSARHLSEEDVAARVASLPPQVSVTASFQLSTFVTAAAARDHGRT